MRKASLKNRLLKWMRTHGQWTHVGMIEKQGQQAGYLGGTASRRARELAEEGLLLVDERKGERSKCAWYRATGPTKVIKKIARRPDGEIIKEWTEQVWN